MTTGEQQQIAREELLPCPFCGGLGVLLETHDFPQRKKVWIQCSKCGAQSPRFPYYDKDKLGADEAWEAWRKRPEQIISKQEWTVEKLDEILDLKFERGPVDLKVSEYIERLRILAFKINAALAAERRLVEWCLVHAPTTDEPVKCCPCCEAVNERRRFAKAIVDANTNYNALLSTQAAIEKHNKFVREFPDDPAYEIEIDLSTIKESKQ